MSTKLTGRVLRPSDPGWDGARHGFAAAYDYDAAVPSVIVFCQDKYDVANAVRWARAHQVPIRARCGRHNYQAYSSLVKGGIIIDVSDLDTVRVDAEERLAEVGAGQDMVELTEKLCDCGVALPLATGPSVGIAGLTLGGGFGMLTRKYGLVCDNLVEVEMVDANGDFLTASLDENSDLFWACQGGGGGNFGIVTSFIFRVHPVGMVAAFTINWSWDQFVKVVDNWQKWAPVVDDGISTAIALITKTDASPYSMYLYGQYTAPESDLPKVNDLLKPMLEGTTPEPFQVQFVPHRIAQRAFFGLDPAKPEWAVNAHNDRQIYKSSSAVAMDIFPLDVIAQYKAHLEAVPPLAALPSQPSMIQFLGGGGYASRIPEDATAVAHRAAKFIVQYDGYWTAPQDAAPTIDWVESFRTKMLPYANHAYVNYADETLPDYLEQYYAGNLERLKDVKRRYDPEGVFTYPQAIPS